MSTYSYKKVFGKEMGVYFEGARILAVEVFGERIESEMNAIIKMKNCILNVAMHQEEVVGFKLGFEDFPNRFYSSTGAVSTNHRNKGIASQLMTIQHQSCVELGIKAIRTETKNEFADMIKLNLKFNFNIIGSYTDHRGEPKIIFEKKI